MFDIIQAAGRPRWARMIPAPVVISNNKLIVSKYVSSYLRLFVFFI